MKSWHEILSDVGWPTHTLVLDFESYYDNNYAMFDDKLSIVEYIADDRFEFLGVGIKWLDVNHESETHFINGPEVKNFIYTIQQIHGKNLEKLILVVANAKFEGLVFKHHFGFVPPYIVDVLDLSRTQDARDRHNVRDCAVRYDLQPKKNSLDKYIKGKHFKDLTPPLKILLDDYCCTDVNIEVELFKLLLPKLSRPDYELRVARHSVKMYTNPLLCLNYEKADDLMYQMNEEMLSAVQETGHTQKDISGNKSFTKLITESMPEGETPPIKYGKKGPLLAIAKTDLGRDTLLYHPESKVRNLMEARLAVRSWPLHIKRITRLINQANALNGRIGMPLKYWGAHTGRYSGEQAINPQNFASRGDELLKSIKNILEVCYPFTLIISDLSAIEAVVTAVLAGQEDLVESFRRGEDVYCEFASDLFKSAVRKPKDSDSLPIAKILTTRRFIGKQSILGLGYGMGYVRFFSDLKNKYVETKDLVRDGEITEHFIEKAVKFYRNKYKYIPAFWNEVERAFRFVGKYPGEHKEIERCNIKFHSVGSVVYITLPSGRELRYPHVRVRLDREISWKYGGLWGGALVENIVQALSRDILTDAILKIEGGGIPVVLTVHDSTIAVSIKNKAEENKQIIENIMTTPPDWYPTIPLSVESVISDYYK